MTCLCRHKGEAELYLQPIHRLGTRKGWLIDKDMHILTLV